LATTTHQGLTAIADWAGGWGVIAQAAAERLTARPGHAPRNRDHSAAILSNSRTVPRRAAATSRAPGCTAASGARVGPSTSAK